MYERKAQISQKYELEKEYISNIRVVVAAAPCGFAAPTQSDRKKLFINFLVSQYVAFT
jgi:hypothetical protein